MSKKQNSPSNEIVEHKMKVSVYMWAVNVLNLLS